MRFLVALFLMTTPALAMPQCASRDAMEQSLAIEFGEVRRSIAVTRDRNLMETYASAETGTWTITITLPDGKTCLAASGTDFQMTVPEMPPLGDPA